MTIQARTHHHLPTFLIIGAGRAGTTSIYYYLRQHPEIFMSPIKEVNYFAYDPETMGELVNIDASSYPIKSMTAYRKLFRPGAAYAARGEASPMYLWHPSAAENIHTHLPDARLIAILRNPLDRAYSAYLMYASQGFERRRFEQAILDEIRAARNGSWPLGRGVYIGLGRYAGQLEHYFRFFERKQINILLQEDLENDAQQTLRQIYDFVGVDNDMVPHSLLRHNASGLPRNRFIAFLFKPRKAVKRLRRVLPPRIHDPVFHRLMNIRDRNLTRPPLDATIRRTLTDIFRDDIKHTQELIGRDLNHWLA